MDEEGNEIDPREELVQRLLEYKRYKSVLEEMRQMEEMRGLQSHRGNVSRELQRIANKALVDAELESVNLFKLLRAFERIMERFETAHPKSVHRIVQFSYTIEEQQSHIFQEYTPVICLAFRKFSRSVRTASMPSSPSLPCSSCSTFR